MGQRKMNRALAIKMAIAALNDKKKLSAFDANLYRMGVIDNTTTAAHDRYTLIDEAISELQNIGGAPATADSNRVRD